ncbi:MAG: hypothetical protein EHM23_36335 [Acidobacteria bacterium]|nr:MAG: hypothetical protein EHM23_36335 [Acidobacteriota bacterium]
MTSDFSNGNSECLSRFVRGDFSVTEFRRADLKEYYITCFPETSGNSNEQIGEMYARVSEFLEKLGAEVVSERCYGETEVFPEVKAARAQLYQPAWPRVRRKPVVCWRYSRSEEGTSGAAALGYQGQGPAGGPHHGG